MSVQETASPGASTQTVTKENIYQSLFEKIHLTPVTSLKEIGEWQSNEAMAEASTDERVSAAIQVLLSCVASSGKNIEKLDKSLLDFHISQLDRKISAQLDAVMHHPEFKKVESLWRGTWSMVSGIDFRKNVKVELLDVSKQHLREDFDDAPEIIQSGFYRHTYIEEYDTPGGEPIASVISSYEFDNSPQDIALLRNISRVAAASHMPFIGAVGPAFFLKNSMEEVAAIKDIGNYFDRAEYIKWKAFRETDDARYIGLTMPNVLGRLPYGPDTVPVRNFNYVEAVKGPDHDKYLWTSAAFAFATNMAKSFINNGWCVQIRGPQAGGAVTDLPIHLYDLGTGNQVKIPTEVMIPETREFEFANLGFIPLSYYKNRDYACFFSANSTQKPALYDTADATANSRINARLPYVFLLSRIAHYQNVLKQVSRNYADMTLADMTSDTQADALFSTEQIVPGMFTRQAWEGQVKEAIEQVVAARREEIDWVLSDREKGASSDVSPETLRARLTERYFIDFAGSWLSFLNSLRWKKEGTLSGVLDQLTLMADAHQSPLIALMDTLAWQAATGRPNRGLSDSLTTSAKALFNGEEQGRQDETPPGPLDKTFAPLLRLAGERAAGSGDATLSLQTYLTRVSRVRLKLQQVINAQDPQEMTQQLAQTVFQGKTVDLTDTRDYGRLVAASLGEAWSGFGQALFVRPVEQAWRQVLTPAAESLNRQWQRAIVSQWEQDFAGRYPFSATQNDASLPLLAQYLRDGGRIHQYLATHLGGVLRREGRDWVTDATNTQGLVVNPAFLRSLNQLGDITDAAFASGDAGIHFDLRAKPARDVMKTQLTVDGQILEYFNQKERWQRFTWPGEQWHPGASLSWTSTQNSERILADYRGSWSLIRLLEQAEITQLDSSSYKVLWRAPDGLPLHYLMRVEQGKGPMALLALRNFRLPQQIFLTGNVMAESQEQGEHEDE